MITAWILAGMNPLILCNHQESQTPKHHEWRTFFFGVSYQSLTLATILLKPSLSFTNLHCCCTDIPTANARLWKKVARWRPLLLRPSIRPCKTNFSKPSSSRSVCPWNTTVKNTFRYRRKIFYQYLEEHVWPKEKCCSWRIMLHAIQKKTPKTGRAEVELGDFYGQVSHQTWIR